jgi:two-component system, NtrC family, nitrogen regulation sensor histidine kinase NtrY
VIFTCSAAPAGVDLAIEDNGHGVPEDPDLLFLPFYTTRPGDDGIGLSLVRQVALAHPGTISVQRTQPGTRFTLFLPSQD